MATIDFENIDSDSTDNKYLDLCKKRKIYRSSESL